MRTVAGEVSSGCLLAHSSGRRLAFYWYYSINVIVPRDSGLVWNLHFKPTAHLFQLKLSLFYVQFRSNLKPNTILEYWRWTADNAEIIANTDQWDNVESIKSENSIFII